MTQTAEQRADVALERIRVVKVLRRLRGRGEMFASLKGWLNDPHRGSRPWDRPVLEEAAAHIRGLERMIDEAEAEGVFSDTRFGEMLEEAAPLAERVRTISDAAFAELVPERGSG